MNAQRAAPALAESRRALIGRVYSPAKADIQTVVGAAAAKVELPVDSA